MQIFGFWAQALPEIVIFFARGNSLSQNRKLCTLAGKFLLAASVHGRSAGPEAGRGVPTPPSLPLDSTHPATGQGLHALDNPKEEVEAQKS